jgi:peroxiredoxin family protein
MEFMGLMQDDLPPFVDSVVGVATFLADAGDSKINLLI